jgi:hypothetical protein
MAEPFNTNVLQHFHQRIMITYITYTIAIYYYMRYLAIETENLGNPENCELKTENRKPYDYLTNQFQQVTPFSLLHRASTAPQTKRKQALSVR